MKFQEQFQLQIKKSSEPIKIDGMLDEKDWAEAGEAHDFFMKWPNDEGRPKRKTFVRVTYDNQFIYFGIKAMDTSFYVAQTLKRDQGIYDSDAVSIALDPVNQRTNGFIFSITPYNVQTEDLVNVGQSDDEMSFSWDNKWYSATSRHKDHWIAEIAIPFSTLRFKQGNSKWGFNVLRADLKNNEYSTWTDMPLNFNFFDFGYSGAILWDNPPAAPKSNISLIPYTTGSYNADRENNVSANGKLNGGFDAKLSLTPSLNLDLTVNPDFSQVEVDRQVTNLSRFELFFPERRQFFLENADLFSNLGFPNTRPFFSRRIGLNTDIDFGARLSGRIDKNWRIGLMDIKTSANDDINLASQNFAVMALQRKLFKKSSIELFYIDRTALAFNGKTNEAGGCNCVYKHDGNAFNRNIGFEYYLAPPNNTFSGKTIFIKSFTPNATGNDFLNAANFQYNQRKWILSWQHEIVGENYNAEVGYVPRNNYIKFNPSITRLFFPRSGAILSHGPQFTSTYYYNNDFITTDYSNALIYLITYRDKSTLSAVAQNTFVELLSPFDPTRIGKLPLEKGTRHKWTNIGLDWTSPPQYILTYSLSTRVGGYYANGHLLSISGNVGYRIQPYVNIDFSSTYNQIKLPSPWGNNNFLLLGPKLDVTFSNKLFLTTFFQYNEQTKNINFNTRFQWRYKPVSDLFIVYTDNYYIGPVFVKNRAVVLKFTYWWNK